LHLWPEKKAEPYWHPEDKYCPAVDEHNQKWMPDATYINTEANSQI
jgi:hypothetical protein